MSQPEEDRRPVFGLGVRVHRASLIVATLGGLIGGVLLGERLIGGGWGEILGAILGTLLMETLFHRLVPARCPNCGQRARCHLSHRYIETAGETQSATVIQYECVACGFGQGKGARNRYSE